MLEKSEKNSNKQAKLPDLKEDDKKKLPKRKKSLKVCLPSLPLPPPPPRFAATHPPHSRAPVQLTRSRTGTPAAAVASPSAPSTSATSLHPTGRPQAHYFRAAAAGSLRGDPER